MPLSRSFLTATAALMLCLLAACTATRHTAQQQNLQQNTQLATCTRQDLQYNLYLLPADSTTPPSKKAAPYTRLSIRIINTATNASPLRRLSHNIDEYSTYYQYLLNGATADLQLIDNGTILYPVFYAFENNYNAFPFETINVGYKYNLRRKRSKNHELKLVYTDRVFARDTIVFHLNHTNSL